MTAVFAAMLTDFARAVAANDGAGLAALFTEDGIYNDGFFGPYQGRERIADMLAHFHDTGRDFRWDFLDPVRAGDIGYARYCFSYASRMPGAEGKPVVFEGMGQFRFQGALIAEYSEVFDRGVALAQLDFAPERLAKVLRRAAETHRATPLAREHVARLG